MLKKLKDTKMLNSKYFLTTINSIYWQQNINDGLSQYESEISTNGILYIKQFLKVFCHTFDKKYTMLIYLFNIFILLSSIKSYGEDLIQKINRNETLKDGRKILEVENYYYDSKGKKIKHGLSLFKWKDKTLSGAVIGVNKQGSFWHGKRNGLWIYETPYITTYTVYDRGNLLDITSFNSAGDRVSRCLFKNNKPFQGTIWDELDTVWGVKQSWLEFYKAGKLIKKIECDEKGKPVGKHRVPVQKNPPPPPQENDSEKR